PHMYSHWWLGLHDLGLTRADNPGFGLALVLAFLLVALAALRPRSRGELGWYFLVLGSPAILLACDRANNDLAVFVLLALVVPCLRSSQRLVRLLAVFPIALAAGLKFYPAVAALVLLAGPDAREVRLRLLLAVLALLLVAASVGPDYLRLAPMLPRASGLTTFGALNFLEELGLTGRAALVAELAFVALAALLAGLLLLAEIAPAASGDGADALGFILGATLLTACFLVGSNYAYRWVFAVWMAPLLWRWPRAPDTPRRLRLLCQFTAGLLLVALWLDALVGAVLTLFKARIPGDKLVAWADEVFLWEQPLTWLLFGCLLCFLLPFAWSRGRALIAGAAAG